MEKNDLSGLNDTNDIFSLGKEDCRFFYMESMMKN